MECLPCALAADHHPSVSWTSIAAFQAGSIGLEDLSRKLAHGFLLRVRGALQLSSSAFCTMPCINHIKKPPLGSFLGYFPNALMETSDLDFIFMLEMYRYKIMLVTASFKANSEYSVRCG